MPWFLHCDNPIQIISVTIYNTHNLQATHNVQIITLTLSILQYAEIAEIVKMEKPQT